MIIHELVVCVMVVDVRSVDGQLSKCARRQQESVQRKVRKDSKWAIWEKHQSKIFQKQDLRTKGKPDDGIIKEKRVVESEWVRSRS